MTKAAILSDLQREFPEATSSEFRGDSRILVPREDLNGLLQSLRTRGGFDLLLDITCVDYLHLPDATDRFGLVYVLGKSQDATRLIVRCFLNEPDLIVPSVVPIWKGADWLEREVWDMYGITFDGHPDHRRILLPEEFTAHPLRKDYPLQGHGERHNFPTLPRGEA